jgi:hypothetical protein
VTYPLSVGSRTKSEVLGPAKREAPPKRGLSVIQSVGAEVSAPTTIPCHTICGLQTPVISVGQRSRKPDTAKFKFGHKGLNPASTESANQDDSGLLKDLAQKADRRLIATALFARDCAATLFDRSGHHAALLRRADGNAAWADADGGT